MASDIDICNLALGRLGDVAEVTAINPPDSSTQARLCKIFYPIARDAMFEMHSWGCATQNVTLAAVSVPASAPQWQYAYAMPNNALNVLAIYDPTASDDVVFPIQQYHNALFDTTGVALLTAQNFVCESDTDGNQIILTNQENAVARISVRVTDTSKFSPLMVDALAWLLASYLAGPILKGETGVEMGQACLKAFVGMFGRATASDANQRRLNPNQSTIAAWMANR